MRWFLASSILGSSQNFASPSGEDTWTWHRGSSREKKKKRNGPSRNTVGLIACPRSTWPPLVKDGRKRVGRVLFFVSLGSSSPVLTAGPFLRVLITLRFYAELNDHLAPERRQVAFEVAATGRGSVGEVIEALGVPRAEVDLVLVEGRSVDLSHPVGEGDRVSVFPVFESLDITPVLEVRERPLRRTRFVLDTHLGRLATYLRLLGFDALYRNDYDDPELVRVSVDERRILLTRDRALLERRELTHGYSVRETSPRRQLAEVVERFDLPGSAAPFTRCLVCNERLRPVPKEAVLERLPPRTRQEHDEFRICPGCDRVVWKGSHYRRMRQFVDAVLGAP